MTSGSLILRTTARALQPLLLLFSAFLLLRGHDEPGGGFSGGLVAAAAFGLYTLAFGAAGARRALHVDPHMLLGSGLLLAAGSGLAGLLRGDFLAAFWGTLHLPVLGAVTIGTPLLFDVGVYLVVVGMTMSVILTLEEEKR